MTYSGNGLVLWMERACFSAVATMRTLRAACADNDIGVVSEIIKQYGDQIHIYSVVDAMLIAHAFNHSDLEAVFIEYFDRCQSSRLAEAMRELHRKNYSKITCMLKRFGPRIEKHISWLLGEICRFDGSVKNARRILRHFRVDATDAGYALQKAAASGNPELVQLFLTHADHIPTRSIGVSIRVACASGKPAVVALFLEWYGDHRFDIDDIGEAIVEALDDDACDDCIEERLAAMQLLLNRFGDRISASDIGAALVNACVNYHVDAVQLLLERFGGGRIDDRRIDAEGVNRALIRALDCGEFCGNDPDELGRLTTITRTLLEHVAERGDCRDLDLHAMLKYACSRSRGYLDVALLILDRIGDEIDVEAVGAALRETACGGFVELSCALLERLDHCRTAELTDEAIVDALRKSCQEPHSAILRMLLVRYAHRVSNDGINTFLLNAYRFSNHNVEAIQVIFEYLGDRVRVWMLHDYLTDDIVEGFALDRDRFHAVVETCDDDEARLVDLVPELWRWVPEEDLGPKSAAKLR